MVEAGHPARGPVAITQSRTSWGIELGRHRLAVTRMREARTVGGADAARDRPTTPRSVWPVAIGTFASVSAFGLIVFGAVASEPLSFAGHQRYSLSVPLPARSARATPDRSTRPPKARVAAAIPPAVTLDDGADGSALPILADEIYVARAVRTGEFQEWLGADGQRRFLSAGPEQVDGDRRCRALALLIRRADGGNEVRNSRHCTDAPASGPATVSLEEDAPSRAASDVALVSPEEEAAGQDAATLGR